MIESSSTANEWMRMQEQIHSIALESKRFKIGIAFNENRIICMPLFENYKILYTSTDKKEADEHLSEAMKFIKPYLNRCENKETLRFENLNEDKTGNYIIFILFDKE